MRPRFWIEQSCSKVIHFSPPLAPPAPKRSTWPCGNASTFCLHVVGVSWAMPPPQMPLKLGLFWFCATIDVGPIAKIASATTLMPSRDCFMVMNASLSLRQDVDVSSARRLAALFLRESDLDVLAIRESERVDEAEVLARAVGMNVDLVLGADLEQPPIADAEPTQPVRPDRFDRPDGHRAVLVLHIEMEPGVRIGPVHLLERAGQDEVLGDVELCLDRVMRGCRRGSGERERSQQGEQCKLAHSAFSSFIAARITALPSVVPAQAGTHNHRAIDISPAVPHRKDTAYGSPLSRGRHCGMVVHKRQHLFRSIYCAFANSSGSGNTT